MHSGNRSLRLFLTCSLLGLMTALPAAAAEGDWPQWRGPQRDGHAAPQSLLQQWPEGGPKMKWEARNCGEGYSACSVADGRLFTMGARGEQCFVLCLSAANGETMWETPISRASSDQDYLHGWGGGPRSTPTIDGDLAYVLSDVGILACLKVADGSIVWKVDLVADFGGEIPKWGYSESPLIDGQRVVVTAGRKNFLVALDKKNGEKLWNSDGPDTPAHYVSIITHQAGDAKLYVTAAQSGLIVIDAESGKMVLSGPETGNNIAVIPTPISSGNLIYHTSDYNAGNGLWKLTTSGKDVAGQLVYHHQQDSMQNHHGGVVLVDGVIYGHTKVNRGQWMAQDLESGETLWSQAIGRNTSGSIAYADGRLYFYGDKDATLHLVEPSRDELKVVGQLTLPEQTEIARKQGAIWAHPVIANQMVFIRDQNLIFAYDIAR